MSALALALALAAAPTSVTFPVPVRVAGDSCKSTSSGVVRISGDRTLIDRVGEETGWTRTTETTVLAVVGGKVTKKRVRVLESRSHAVHGGVREQSTREGHGDSFILTRVTDGGRFEVRNEDGTAVTNGQRDAVGSSEIDEDRAPLLDGRTMKLKEKIHFDAEEGRRYFPFRDWEGAVVKGFDMTLGKIEGERARIDVTVLFGIADSAGADVSLKGWFTMWTDLEQKNSKITLEGPVRMTMAGKTIKGTYEASGESVCTGPPPLLEPRDAPVNTPVGTPARDTPVGPAVDAGAP